MSRTRRRRVLFLLCLTPSHRFFFPFSRLTTFVFALFSKRLILASTILIF